MAKSFARLVEKYSFARFANVEEDDEDEEEEEAEHEKACEKASGEEKVCPMLSPSSLSEE